MALLQRLLFFPVLITLLMGTLLMFPFFHGHIPRQREAVFIANLLLLVTANKLLSDSLTNEPTMYMMGDWQAQLDISLVNDPLVAVMLLRTAMLALAAHMYASADDDQKGPSFHRIFMYQIMGVNGAFLTGDVFNLFVFVFFEILLISSNALIIHGGGKQRTQAAVHYVLLNLAGASFSIMPPGSGPLC